MKIHEYQAKELLQLAQVPILSGILCSSLDQITQAADTLGYPCVLKAQIHAGGRGKGGGVKLAKNKEEAKTLGEAILGMQLVTPQTGPEGQKVNSLLVEQGCAILKSIMLAYCLIEPAADCASWFQQKAEWTLKKSPKITPKKSLKNGLIQQRDSCPIKHAT